MEILAEIHRVTGVDLRQDNLAIQVTEQDIANGDPANMEQCALALALQGSGFQAVHINAEGIYFRPAAASEKETCCLISRYFVAAESSMRAFVSAFDAAAAKPGTLVIRQHGPGHWPTAGFQAAA